MIDYRNVIRNRELRLKLIDKLAFIPDEPYLKMVYRIKTGRKLNLKNPVGFNEKLNWLKLHDVRPEYTQLADKLLVREHIRQTLGEDYCIPLLGAWDRFEDIDFDALPEKFVLKCNHDSGSVKFIKEKSALTEKDRQLLRKFYDGRLKHNPYHLAREYPYRDIHPMILAEEYMEAPGGINDYKFFCFDGEPKLMFTVSGRYGEKHEDYFDMDYNWIIIENGSTPSAEPPIKPKCFEEMKELCKKLSDGMAQVRMDFYEIDGKVYFGEFTFFPAGGFLLFEPEDWEYKLGEYIKI